MFNFFSPKVKNHYFLVLAVCILSTYNVLLVHLRSGDEWNLRFIATNSPIWEVTFALMKAIYPALGKYCLGKVQKEPLFARKGEQQKSLSVLSCGLVSQFRQPNVPCQVCVVAAISALAEAPPNCFWFPLSKMKSFFAARPWSSMLQARNKHTNQQLQLLHPPFHLVPCCSQSLSVLLHSQPTFLHYCFTRWPPDSCTTTPDSCAAFTVLSYVVASTSCWLLSWLL